MNKWTLAATVALLAVLTASYMMLSRRDLRRPLAVEGGPVESEVLEISESEASDAGLSAKPAPPAGRRPQPRQAPVGAAIETIDEADDPGETIDVPVLVEEDEEEPIGAAAESDR